MANEVSVQCSIVASKAGAYTTSNTSGVTFNYSMTGADMIGTTQTATSTYTAIDKGATGTIGWLWMRCLGVAGTDSVAVSIRGDTTADLVLNGGGPPALVPINGATAPKIKYLTGAGCDVFYVIAEA